VAITLLQKDGHRVSLVENGKQAVELCARETFDLILMDVQMPEMDGLQATGLIRKNQSSRHAHTPIIAMTALAMKEDQERCLAAGMDGYVTKPIQFAELIRMVHTFSGNAPAEPEAAAPAPWSGPGTTPGLIRL
jgi:CheY-like chemotaxis protein